MTDALTAHVAKHIWAQRQWKVETTVDEYLTDIRVACASPHARYVLYERHSRPFAGVIVATAEVVPVQRIGEGAGPVLMVVYSPLSAMIVTAYMVQGVEAANMPAGAIWLT